MRLSYVFDENLPSSETDTEQVINTISALSHHDVAIELVVPQRKGTAPVTTEMLRDYYQVSGNFTIRQVPAGLSFLRPLEKLVHAKRGVGAVGTHDVVYSRNLAVIEFALRAGHRVMYEHYRPWPDQYPPLEPWLRRMLRHPHLLGMVLHSEHVRASYEQLDVPKEKLFVAHNGYDPARMELRLSREEAREKLALPQGKPMVVYTGRINERKGLSAVLSLAAKTPEAIFVLVGSQQQGTIETRAAELPNVIVRPWQPFRTTIEYMYAADILIIPPTLEPLQQFGTTVLPMKLFLYLASGRAIFAPRSPDTAELLVHDRNAVLVPADDLEAQVTELKDLLSRPERQQRVIDGAMLDALELTWDTRARHLKAYLEERLGLGPQTLPNGQWNTSSWVKRSALWAWNKVT